MSRTQQGHQIFERKAREAFGHDGAKENLMNEAPEDPQNQIFQEIRDSHEKISGEDMVLLEKKQNLEGTC